MKTFDIAVHFQRTVELNEDCPYDEFQIVNALNGHGPYSIICTPKGDLVDMGRNKTLGKVTGDGPANARFRLI
jgi:hypothetical protein